MIGGQSGNGGRSGGCGRTHLQLEAASIHELQWVLGVGVGTGRRGRSHPKVTQGDLK